MNLKITTLTNFTKSFIETLNKYATIKKKYVSKSHANFVTKDLQKAIMLKSRLGIFSQKKNIYSLKRLTTNNATFALVWLKKLK